MSLPDLACPELNEAELEALAQLDGLFVWDFMYHRSLFPFGTRDQEKKNCDISNFGMSKMISELEVILSQLRALISSRFDVTLCEPPNGLDSVSDDEVTLGKFSLSESLNLALFENKGTCSFVPKEEAVEDLTKAGLLPNMSNKSRKCRFANSSKRKRLKIEKNLVEIKDETSDAIKTESNNDDLGVDQYVDVIMGVMNEEENSSDKKDLTLAEMNCHMNQLSDGTIRCSVMDCPSADVSYESSEVFKKHFVESHWKLREKAYGCIVCCKLFATAEQRNSHVELDCPLAKSSNSQMEDKQPMETSEKNEAHECQRFPCLECDKTFTLANMLQKHQKSAHQKKRKAIGPSGFNWNIKTSTDERGFLRNNLNELIPRFRPSGSSDDPAGCQSAVCDEPGCTTTQVFNSLRAVQGHYQASHVPTDLKIYDCSSCDKVFAFKLLLQCHKKIHSKKHRCNHCERTFSSPLQLQAHEDGHLGIKRFTCEHCPYRATMKHQVKKHSREKHPEMETGDFSCELCGKLCSTRGHLNMHLTQAHGTLDDQGKNPRYARESKTGKGPLKCDICGFETERRDVFRKHKEATHGSEKLPCHLCGKVFKCKAYLKYHVTYVHEGKQRTKKIT